MLKRLVFFTIVFAVAGWLLVSPSMATKEIAKKEQKSCLTCHVKNGEKELNEAGEYYKANKTLDGFKKKK